MSLHRYLPTPSDRMGIIWTLLTIKDAVVLEYGPAGTTHFSVGAYGSMGLETEQKIFTTHLSEDDIIMGDVTRLEDAIIEIDENYQPEMIFVVSSAVVSVIGADIKGVCKYMQQETRAKLIPVDTGGFKGDYSVGLREGWQLIVKNLCKEKKEVCDNIYNILGASPYNYRIKSDVAEIKRLMTEAFGMECNVTLGMDHSIAEIQDMSKSCINLVIQAEALPTAEYLKEKFGIPYIYQTPYGYKGTSQWLQKIAECTGRQINEALSKELRTRQMESAGLKMYASMYANGEVVPNTAVVGEYDTVVGITHAMEEVNLKSALMMANHSVTGIEQEEVVYPQTEKERIDLIRSLKYSLVFGDDITLHLCDDSCEKVIASAPLLNRAQHATHLPFMGIRGMDYMMEQIERYYSRL